MLYFESKEEAMTTKRYLDGLLYKDQLLVADVADQLKHFVSRYFPEALYILQPYYKTEYNN